MGGSVKNKQEKRKRPRTHLTMAFMMRTADTEPVELWLAAQSIFWGLWAASPLWDVYSTSPIYGVMSNVAPSWMWGIAFLLIGSSKLFGVLRMHYSTRRASAFLGATIWTFAWTSFVATDPRAHSVVMHAFPILANAWVYLRLQRRSQ